MTEATVRGDLVRALRATIPEAVALRYEDRYTKGLPDLSLTWRGRTSFWEVKYADPSCVSSEVQHHLCTALDRHGFCCNYIIYQERTTTRARQIRVVTPDEFAHWAHLGIVVSEDRFDHAALVDHMIAAHK